MKISSKLSSEIRKVISDHFFNILCELDEKDRQNVIPHSVWRELHEKTSKEKSSLETEILSKINSYSGKRR